MKKIYFCPVNKPIFGTNEHTHMINRKSTPRLLLLLAEVIALAILAVGAVSHFGMADGARITVAYSAAYLIPRIVLTRAKGSSTPALVLLLMVAALMIYIDFHKLGMWTLFDGYSLEEPNVQGDGRIYYKWALNKYDGRVKPQNVIYPGYPMIILAWWKLFGVNVIWPQAMNLMCTLMGIVLTGMTTRRLLAHRVTTSPQALVISGMALTCLLTYFLIMGTMIIKEGTVILAISMVSYVLASMTAKEGCHSQVRNMLLMIVACILLAMVRTTYLYFVAMGVIITALPHWRRDWPIRSSMLAIIVLSLILGAMLSTHHFDRHVEVAGGGWNMQRFYVESESQQFYHDLLDYYFLRPFWYKALMLPLTMSVQFIIPFPWTYYENSTFINLFSRMTYGWYLVGGTALFYYPMMSWRRGKDNMGAWPWWAALSFAAIAWVMAGSVARYVTPIQPLFVPVAVFVLCRLREGRLRKAFTIWSICFVLLVAITLLFCLEIQQAAISKWLHTRSLVHYLKGIPY